MLKHNLRFYLLQMLLATFRASGNLSLGVKIMRYCLIAFSAACCSAALLLVPSRGETAEKAVPPAWWKDSAAKLESELAARHGESCRARLQRGLKQVGEFWRIEDGDAAALEAFVRENFAADQATQDALFDRFERLLEKIDGHMAELPLRVPPPDRSGPRTRLAGG